MTRLLTLLLLLFFSTAGYAQTYLTGVVTDASGNPLVGAAVLVETTTHGTVSDIDGRYRLGWGRDTATLLVSYTGYAPQTLRAVVGRPDTIVLKDGVALEEVVVVGYGISHTSADRAMSVSAAPDYSRPGKRADRRADSTVGMAAGATSGKPGDGTAPAPGQLTAGEVNDFGKWDMWADISQEDLGEHQATWGVFPEHRYTVQLLHPDGSPAVNEPVSLTGGGKTVWRARTDNEGRAELWRAMDGVDDAQARYRIVAGRSTPLHAYGVTSVSAIPFTEGINTIRLSYDCASTPAVDVAFVVDATGSMGDEIRYLTSELRDVMQRAGDTLGGQPLRTAAVFYRDKGDDYLTRSIDFRSETKEVETFFARQSAGGGGDTPEAVGAALETALDSLSWDDAAVTRLLFLVLDAPPHRDSAEVAGMQRLTREAAGRGIRIIPVVCSGMDKSGEYLMRSLALATNGTYTFLTDDSGIGGDHLEPTTDHYEVEKLNDLLVRLIEQYGRSAECGSSPELVVPRQQPTDPAVAWSVFPNPTDGPVTLRLPRAKGEVFLLDAFGKLLRRVAVDRRKLTLELGELPAGAYLLRYRVKGEDSTQWVVRK